MAYHVAVWSLRRGLISPPEQVSFVQEARIQAQLAIDYERSRMVQYERDVPLSVEQMWYEQGALMGYYTKRKPAREERAA